MKTTALRLKPGVDPLTTTMWPVNLIKDDPTPIYKEAKNSVEWDYHAVFDHF